MTPLFVPINNSHVKTSLLIKIFIWLLLPGIFFSQNAFYISGSLYNISCLVQMEYIYKVPEKFESPFYICEFNLSL